MKLLPTEFRKHGYEFRQLQREGDVALFEKRQGTVVAYEVVIVQRHEEYVMAGNTIAAAEAMPGNETWGLKGWSPRTLPEALVKFSAVCVMHEDKMMEQALKNLGGAA